MAGPGNPPLTSADDRRQRLLPMVLGLVSALPFGLLVYLIRDQVLVPFKFVPPRAALAEIFLWIVLVLGGALGVSLAAARRSVAVWVFLALLVGATLVGSGRAHRPLEEFQQLDPLTRIISLAVVWVLVTLLAAWAGTAKQQYRYFIGAGIVSGAIFSFLVVPLGSGEFRAGLLAFMSGMAIDNIAARDTAVRKAVGGVNSWIADGAKYIAGLDPSNPSRQAFLVTALTYFFWSGILVVLASLVVFTISSGIVSAANGPAQPPSAPPAPAGSGTPVPSPS